MNFLVLGGGAQGSAAAFDLLRREEVERVVLADAHAGALPGFLANGFEGRLERREIDATDEAAVLEAMEGMDAVACALPYHFNVRMTRLAVRAGRHYCDLGGHTADVKTQRRFDAEAADRGVSVIPDCGLAPGLTTVLAQAGIDRLDEAGSVRIWVGGLPQAPKPPLRYHIVYSLEGMLDYYTTPSVVLRGGEITEVEPLTEVERVTFPPPLGELEAFHTSGGISTLPHRYEGRIPEMIYKTLRYPGHAEIMRAIRDLGLLDATPLEVAGASVAPRDLFIRRVTPHLRDPDAKDLVALRVEVRGVRDGRCRKVRFEMVDRFDEEFGLTAMMRTTGFPLALTALMQAQGRVAGSGVRTPDEAVPGDAFVAELGRRGIRIERSEG